MSKLQELRDMVSKQFEGAESKEQIEAFAALNNKLDEVSKEQDDTLAKYAELVKSYKDLVKHTSFKEPSPSVAQDTGIGLVPSIEDALNTFLENNNK